MTAYPVDRANRMSWNPPQIRYARLLAVWLFIWSIEALRFAPAGSPAASPAATPSLICHTSNPADCYPAEFSPTESFEVVHDDQIVPRGLHIRMNLETGLTEARLDIENADDVSGKSSGIVVAEQANQAIMLPTTEPMEGSDSIRSDPVGSSVDVNNNSRNRASHHERAEIALDMGALKSLSPTQDLSPYLDTLANLIDLVHDVELGVALCQDEAVVVKLWRLLEQEHQSADAEEVRSSIALLLATALQNNAEARHSLLEILSATDSDTLSPAQVVFDALSRVSRQLDRPRILVPTEFSLCSRIVFLASQIFQDETQYRKFTELKGKQMMQDVMGKLSHLPRGNDRKLANKLKTRIDNFLVDHPDSIATPLRENDTIINEAHEL